ERREIATVERRSDPALHTTSRERRIGMRRRLTSILGVAVLAAACTTPSASPSPASNSAATSGSATPATGPLVIGVLVPFTESAIDADIGASQRRAAE